MHKQHKLCTENKPKPTFLLTDFQLYTLINITVVIDLFYFSTELITEEQVLCTVKSAISSTSRTKGLPDIAGFQIPEHYT
jgi:hypothetical protein